MRRGQAEIIGLALILVLLGIGFLLYVRFSLTADQGGGMRQRYESTQFGQTFVNSLAKSSIACGGQNYTVEELIKEVAQGTTRCAAEQALDERITHALSRTMDGWGVNYRLVIVRKGAVEQTIGLRNFTNPDILERERCSATMDTTAVDAYPIAGVAPPVEMRLEQCG